MPVVRALVKGLETKTPVKVVEEPWHYAAGVCGARSLRCFFKPVVYDLYCTPKRIPDVRGCDHLHDLAFRYLTQPTVQLHKQIVKHVDATKLNAPCVAIHVRRTDTLLNDGWDHKRKLYKWVPLEAYVTAIKPKTTTLLLTDDETVLNETKAFDLDWVWIDRPRHKGTLGGWENHFPSNDRMLEMAVIFALRKLVSKCKMFVGSHSTFGNLMYLGMRNAKQIFVNTRVS